MIKILRKTLEFCQQTILIKETEKEPIRSNIRENFIWPYCRYTTKFSFPRYWRHKVIIYKSQKLDWRIINIFLYYGIKVINKLKAMIKYFLCVTLSTSATYKSIWTETKRIATDKCLQSSRPYINIKINLGFWLKQDTCIKLKTSGNHPLPCLQLS